MIRQWNTDRDTTGTDEAQGLAVALAQVADAEFIQSIIDLKAALDRFGGHAYIASYRRKFDADGEPIESGPGQYHTLAYAFHYSNQDAGQKGLPKAREPEDTTLEEPVVADPE